MEHSPFVTTMPEMPEVETVRRGLVPHWVGRRISFVDLRRPDLRFPFPDGFDEGLTGATVEGIGRASKYLLIRLDNGLTWLSHLGMTGVWTIDADGEGKHDHVYVEFDDGALTATYTDHRRFGIMDLFETAGEADHKLLAGLGPEPLTEEFTPEALKAGLHGRRSPIKTALLDQRIISGLGNIYVSEILHRSGISPLRSAADVSGKSTRINSKIGLMFEQTNEVIAEAIDAGGSTISDFRGVYGKEDLGYFPHQFTVFNRESESCSREGCGGTVRRIVQSGRSTFYCPKCQR
jgi:formamidopyrimidine-DNA glycosylase